MHDPGKEKTEAYYDLITCNVRITRDLNNIHVEQDEKKIINAGTTPEQQKKVSECLQLFNEIMQRLPELPGVPSPKLFDAAENAGTTLCLDAVQMISLEKMIIELKAMQTDISSINAVTR